MPMFELEFPVEPVMLLFEQFQVSIPIPEFNAVPLELMIEL